MSTRTNKRSSSRAHTQCPHCGKRLSGAKGLEAHIAQTHQVARIKAGTKTQ